MFNFIPHSIGYANKRKLKMELVKITSIFTGVINIFLYIGAWFANLDNTKSSILFFVALSMSMYRFWVWRKNSLINQEIRREDLRMKKIINEREVLENERINIEIEILRHNRKKISQ